MDPFLYPRVQVTWNRVEERYRSWLFGDQSLHRAILGSPRLYQFYFDREIISPALITKKKNYPGSENIKRSNEGNEGGDFPKNYPSIAPSDDPICTPSSTWLVGNNFYVVLREGRGGTKFSSFIYIYIYRQIY